MKLYDVLTKKRIEKVAPPEEEYIAPPKKTTFGHIVFWGGIVLVLIIIYTLGVNLARTKVHIKLRRIPFALTDTHIVLVHESKAQAGDVPFQIIKVTDQAQREVIGTQAPFTTVVVKKPAPIKQTVIKKGKKVTVMVTPPPAPVAPKVFTYQIADADRENIANTLSADVFERLKRQTRTQIPDGLLLNPELQFFFFNKNNISFTGNTIAFPAIAQGTLTSYLINTQVLEQAIAATVLHDTKTYPEVVIPEIGSLQIKAISAAPLDPNTIPDTFTISITGTGTIITQASPEEIQKELVGKKTAAFDSILANIPEIDTGTFSMYPFWARNFPKIQSRITVKVD